MPVARNMTPADLRSIRKQLGLTQAEFGALAGNKSARQVKNWESGHTPVPDYVPMLLAGIMPKPK